MERIVKFRHEKIIHVPASRWLNEGNYHRWATEEAVMRLCATHEYWLDGVYFVFVRNVDNDEYGLMEISTLSYASRSPYKSIKWHIAKLKKQLEADACNTLPEVIARYEKLNIDLTAWKISLLF